MKKEWNKHAFITGGSRGIGAATVAMLVKRGWTVDAPTRGDFDVAGLGGQLIIPPNLDALILCAGEWGMARHSAAEWVGEFDRQWKYFIGHLRLMEFCLPALRAAQGCVVAVASTRALIGGVDSAPYSVAKAALVTLMQGFAREYEGVSFNAVCPGLTDTRMAALVRASGGARPDARAQSPESVARVIVNLIESRANGQVVRVVDDAADSVSWQSA